MFLVSVMRCLPAVILVSIYSTMVLGASFQRPDIEGYGEDNDIITPHRGQSLKGYLDMVRYLVSQNKQMPLHKRVSDNNLPNLKYKVDKRNNGIWIWMPAQGYVSVPAQEDNGADDIKSPGKIMRYG